MEEAIRIDPTDPDYFAFSAQIYEDRLKFSKAHDHGRARTRHRPQPPAVLGTAGLRCGSSDGGRRPNRPWLMRSNIAQTTRSFTRSWDGSKLIINVMKSLGTTFWNRCESTPRTVRPTGD